MPNANTSRISRHFLRGVVTAAFSLVPATFLHAEVHSVADALETALQHKALSGREKTVRLFSLSAHYHNGKKRWNFHFYDTGENLHAVTVTDSGKALHHLRNKADHSIFGQLDFSQLPPPREVLLDELIEKGIAAITALKFSPVRDGQIHLRYQLGNNPRRKNETRHLWSVTLPVGDGKMGKTATFLNGRIDTVTNAILSGS